MLAADQRLRRSAEFAAAIRTGVRARRGLLVVHVAADSRAVLAAADSTSGGTSSGTADPGGASSGADRRAGFVIPRAVGSAVRRNLLRRRLRHLLRERLDQLPAGSRLVVRALPGAADCSFPELAADLDQALLLARRRLSPQSRSPRSRDSESRVAAKARP